MSDKSSGIPESILQSIPDRYDYLDTMRGVDAFLKGIPGASLHGLVRCRQSLGALNVIRSW